MRPKNRTRAPPGGAGATANSSSSTPLGATTTGSAPSAAKCWASGADTHRTPSARRAARRSVTAASCARLRARSQAGVPGFSVWATVASAWPSTLCVLKTHGVPSCGPA